MLLVASIVVVEHILAGVVAAAVAAAVGPSFQASSSAAVAVDLDRRRTEDALSDRPQLE